jgi:DMSO/TMAO reductase YedYZ molybdopterin-dependent catalytic subunit
VAEFLRYGALFWEKVPEVPPAPAIAIGGAVAHPVVLPVARLAELPRTDRVADFHCVCGWTTLGLRWSGVSFRTLFETVVRAEAQPAAGVRYVLFTGLDGYRSLLLLEDALADDVLIADRLGDAPLEPDHGAPARLLSPAQYGYKSAKHLRAIDFHVEEPVGLYRLRLRRVVDMLLKPHLRARVWHEERHRFLPAWMIRAAYRAFVPIVRRATQRPKAR